MLGVHRTERSVRGPFLNDNQPSDSYSLLSKNVKMTGTNCCLGKDLSYIQHLRSTSEDLKWRDGERCRPAKI